MVVMADVVVGLVVCVVVGLVVAVVVVVVVGTMAEGVHAVVGDVPRQDGEPLRVVAAAMVVYPYDGGNRGCGRYDGCVHR